MCFTVLGFSGLNKIRVSRKALEFGVVMDFIGLGFWEFGLLGRQAIFQGWDVWGWDLGFWVF
jgi:hypothetical protein